MLCHKENRWQRFYSCDHRSVAEPCGTEHAPVAFDFGGGAERLSIVVGELDRRFSFNRSNFANQTNGIKVGSVRGIAASEIIGEQGSPAGAEANASSWCPFLRVVKICSGSKIINGNA